MAVLPRSVRYALSALAVTVLLTGGAAGLAVMGQGPTDERRNHREHRLLQSSDRNRNRTYDVTNVTVTNRSPFVDQSVEVRVTVENLMSEARTVSIGVHLNDTRVTERSVWLPADGTRSVTFRVTPRQTGTQTLTVGGHDVGTIEVRSGPSNRAFGLLYIALGATLLAFVTASATAAYFERT